MTNLQESGARDSGNEARAGQDAVEEVLLSFDVHVSRSEAESNIKKTFRLHGASMLAFGLLFSIALGWAMWHRLRPDYGILYGVVTGLAFVWQVSKYTRIRIRGAIQQLTQSPSPTRITVTGSGIGFMPVREATNFAVEALKVSEAWDMERGFVPVTEWLSIRDTRRGVTLTTKRLISPSPENRAPSTLAKLLGSRKTMEAMNYRLTIFAPRASLQKAGVEAKFPAVLHQLMAKP